MTEAHPTAAELEEYVIGAAEPAAAARFETHVESCAACAALLRREAQLEVALLEVAQGPARPWRRRPRLWATVAGATLAAAAGWGLLVRSEPPASGAPTVVRCGDPASAPRCISEAKFEGVLSVGPSAAVEVPRYDESPAAAPARSAP